MQRTYDERPFNNPNLDRNGRVLVVCTFHGAADTHSKQDEKQLQLNITVKALARVFPNIVITVCDENNLNYVVHDSGINEYLFDVLLVKNLSMAPVKKCTHLPMLSNIQVRRLLRAKDNLRYSKAHFDWIYYTESDQPPHLTNLNALLQETLHNNRTVVVPHRSYPVALPQDLNVSLVSRKAKEYLDITGQKVVHQIHDLRDFSCCFSPPYTNKEWKSSEIQLFQQWNSHAQANGSCNPFKKTCKTCTIRNRTGNPCPKIAHGMQ